MHSKYLFFAFILIFIFGSCKKSNKPVVFKVTAEPVIYVVGTTIQSRTDIASSNNVATYWSNGEESLLASAEQSTTAICVAISGKDIYIGGSMIVNGVPNAVYWKNGQLNILGAGTIFAVATEGTDIYFAGNSIINNLTLPTYWKNGQAIILPVFSNSVNRFDEGSLYGIAVEENNIYATGGSYSDSFYGATYWKNNIPLLLTVPNTQATDYIAATGISINEGDVYISGLVASTFDKSTAGGALYWKNGSAVFLPSDGDGTCWAILANGNDVYVTGEAGSGTPAVYWKNGLMTTLVINEKPMPNESMFATVKSITLNGDDVYVIGYQWNHGYANVLGPSFPTYWKNGEPTVLPTEIGGQAAAMVILPPTN